MFSCLDVSVFTNPQTLSVAVANGIKRLLLIFDISFLSKRPSSFVIS